MTAITKTCEVSGKAFVIDDYDQAFYNKIGVPLPTLCPEERQRRRLSWRNERSLYYRKCDLCKKQIVSIYDSDSTFPVYCNSCWWSDKWDPLFYGRDFDFSKSFFEQYAELQKVVPRLALFQKNNENCDFTNHTENAKDCYLCVDTGPAQDIYYSKWIINCKDGADSYYMEKCELFYESQYCEGSYNDVFNFYSDYNSDCAFLYNCYYCKNCFMCSDLKHKEYYVFNTFIGKEKYEEFIAKVDLGSHEILTKYRAQYEEMIQNSPKRALILSCEDCDGDCIYQCKNVHDSFDIINSQDCRYCYEGAYMKDCYDTYESAFACESQYECHGCNRGKMLSFSNSSPDVHFSSYVDTCQNSINLFGCISLRQKQYCILNKQYSKEDYESLVATIKEFMQRTKEFGEFFPISLSPFGYNETVANEYFPLSQDEAMTKGFKWKKQNNENEYQGHFVSLPDNIKDTSPEILKGILRCEASGRFYRIIPQELDLCLKLNIALPTRAPQQRYLDRLKIRRPRKVWPHVCFRCGIAIRVPFPDDIKDVYCSACYFSLIN